MLIGYRIHWNWVNTDWQSVSWRLDKVDDLHMKYEWKSCFDFGRISIQNDTIMEEFAHQHIRLADFVNHWRKMMITWCRALRLAPFCCCCSYTNWENFSFLLQVFFIIKMCDHSRFYKELVNSMSFFCLSLPAMHCCSFILATSAASGTKSLIIKMPFGFLRPACWQDVLQQNDSVFACMSVCVWVRCKWHWVCDSQIAVLFY